MYGDESESPDSAEPGQHSFLNSTEMVYHLHSAAKNKAFFYSRLKHRTLIEDEERTYLARSRGELKINKTLTFKLFVPVAIAGIGCRIPKVPFGRAVLPMAGISGCGGLEVIRGVMPVAVEARGVRPDIGAIGASPAEIGVNMARFVPGIMVMLGTTPSPKTQIHTDVFNIYIYIFKAKMHNTKY